MRILPTGITAGVAGVLAWLNAHAARFNLESRTQFNVRDEEYGAVGDGVADDGPALADAYLDAVAQGGGTVIIPAGIYKFTTDLNWTSNKVSIKGAGSSAVTLQATGTAKIIARPNPFTVDQGPTFSGFTLKGDAGSPASAKGIYSGDITASKWSDIVFYGFSGSGSIGMHLENLTNWTEVNKFRRMRFDNCTIGIKCSVDAGSSSNSFARNLWDVHFNLHANQIGMQVTNDALMYGQKGHFDGNAIGNNAVFLDFLGTSSLSGKMDMDFEQTSGTGSVGVREAIPGFQLLCNGTRNYSLTMPEDQGGGLDVLNLPYGLRIREGPGAYMGAIALVGGTATVPTSATKDIAAGQRIYLSRQLAAGGAPRGSLEIGTRTAGVSFVIQSMDPAGALVTGDTSIVAWMIVDKF